MFVVDCKLFISSLRFRILSHYSSQQVVVNIALYMFDSELCIFFSYRVARFLSAAFTVHSILFIQFEENGKKPTKHLHFILIKLHLIDEISVTIRAPRNKEFLFRAE